MKNIMFLCVVAIIFDSCRTNERADANSSASADTAAYAEIHRPQFHFSPTAHWMNDPNGMVYHNGEYHLFYQYYPEGDVWGPMHWGHAVSKDMIGWEHLPIALYPDTLGLIFSGSAVVDVNNTSGFGSKENPPLVAIFTYHSLEKEKAGKTEYQTQGIAYSTDNGRTWTKYENNPVIKNPGIKDFRDPKVFWHEQTSRWVMALAVKDHIELYASKDLKAWNKLSEFGQKYGGHGGVWECPDLVLLPVDGSEEKKWVLLLSINPGGPNGGSATQYFVGNFDGQRFDCEAPPERTVWVDHGPDNYAGVTWSNNPDKNRIIFLGWMSNWAYGQAVPTSPWRSAMTLPRDISLRKVKGEYFIRSMPSREISNAVLKSQVLNLTEVKDSVNLKNSFDFPVSASIIEGSVEARDFYFEFSNGIDQKLLVGYDGAAKRFYIDRSKSGKTSFSENFVGRVYAPRVVDDAKISFKIVSDVSSVEVFYDDGLTVMTALFFPDENYNTLKLKSAGQKISGLEIKQLSSIWKK
jgi:fructan beta-fructosidase